MAPVTPTDLPTASRARTILAAGTWLPWTVAGEPCPAPYFEEGGEPVLVVERATSAWLLEAGYATAESQVLPALGRLRLGGRPWPVAGNAYLAAVRQFRTEHAECHDCCGPRRSHLVGLRVDRVELAPPNSDRFVAVDPDDYLAASPEPVLARSPRVREHLNAEHGEDLVVMAASLLGVPRGALLAASVSGIDAGGLDLSVVDAEGARGFRFPFRRPLSSIDELGQQLHRLLDADGPR